jgi:hypothetical protein
VPSRRLDDRIRALCLKATSASPSEVNKLLDELKEALAEHTRRLRKMAAKELSGVEDWKEKRSR